MNDSDPSDRSSHPSSDHASSSGAIPGLGELSRDNVKAVALNIGRSFGSAAGNGVAEAKRQADDRVRHGAHQVGQQLSVVANAIEQAAIESDFVDEENADKATKAAARISQFAATIEQQNIDSLASEAKKIADRNPLLTIGVAAIAGIALGRFIQSVDNVESEG